MPIYQEPSHSTKKSSTGKTWFGRVRQQLRRNYYRFVERCLGAPEGYMEKSIEQYLKNKSGAKARLRASGYRVYQRSESFDFHGTSYQVTGHQSSPLLASLSDYRFTVSDSAISTLVCSGSDLQTRPSSSQSLETMPDTMQRILESLRFAPRSRESLDFMSETWTKTDMAVVARSFT